MSALQIALIAAQIFGTLEPIVQPFAVAGINALIAAIKSHLSAGTKMSFADVHRLGRAHGVNMTAVYARVGLSVAAGAGLLVMAARGRKRK